MKKYYRLLKDCFEDKDSVLTELINLEAIQHLPKGTEFFVSDLHGEYGAFDYLLRNGSGIVRKKIEECFEETRSEKEKDNLAFVIYYPEEKIKWEVDKEGLPATQKILADMVPDLVQLVQYIEVSILVLKFVNSCLGTLAILLKNFWLRLNDVPTKSSTSR